MEGYIPGKYVMKDGAIWIKAWCYHSQKMHGAVHEVKVAIANEFQHHMTRVRSFNMCGWDSWNVHSCHQFVEANNSLPITLCTSKRNWYLYKWISRERSPSPKQDAITLSTLEASHLVDDDCCLVLYSALLQSDPRLVQHQLLLIIISCTQTVSSSIPLEMAVLLLKKDYVSLPVQLSHEYHKGL